MNEYQEYAKQILDTEEKRKAASAIIAVIGEQALDYKTAHDVLQAIEYLINASSENTEFDSSFVAENLLECNQQQP